MAINYFLWDDTKSPPMFYSYFAKDIEWPLPLPHRIGPALARRHAKINILFEGGAWTEHRLRAGGAL